MSEERKEGDGGKIDTDAFRRGDEEAFAAIVERFLPLVWKIVNGYASTDDDRNDLCQEVFVRVWEQRAKYRDRDLGGWIGKLAHNHARNWRKANEARKSGMEHYSTSYVVPSKEASEMLTNPWRITKYRRLRDAVRGALGQIPRAQAKAFELVHLEGLGVREAARRMDIAPATVRSHISHARKALRTHLADYNDDLS